MGNTLDLEKLHIVVHPGYDIYGREPDEESKRISAKLLAEIGAFSQTIAEKNEALVVLYHQSTARLEEIRVRGEEHGEWPIIPMIDSMQQALEKRMILITSAISLDMESCQKYVSIVQTKLKEIGLCTHKKTRLLCMGIWAGQCVSYVAEDFPPLLGMEENGFVRLRLTNGGFSHNSSLLDVGGVQLARMQQRFPKVEYLPMSLDQE